MAENGRGQSRCDLDSELHVSEGQINEPIGLPSGSIANIIGGELRGGLLAETGSHVEIGGDAALSELSVRGGSVVEMSGGRTEKLTTLAGSQIHFRGEAVVGDFRAHAGSVVHISGGAMGDAARFDSGSFVTLFGTRFFLNGNELDVKKNDVAVLDGDLASIVAHDISSF